MQPALVDSQLQEIADRLPSTWRFGTSSWAFPGWAGLVYDREVSTAALARDGLAAYAQHPLLRAVGLDRTFYAPIPARAFQAYADVVPAHFRFLVKAHGNLTSPRGVFGAGSAEGTRAGRGRAGISSHFLDPAYAADAVIGPAVEGLGERLGVVLFQFPPLRMTHRELSALPERIGRFLEALPAGVPYAVEIRNAALLGEPYADALRLGGATHCYVVHPSMPGVLSQHAQLGAPAGPAPVAVRWMLRPGEQYASAREAYAPFDQLVAPDLASRQEVAALLELVGATHRPVLVIANNKAEGSAPRTLTELARLVAPTRE